MAKTKSLVSYNIGYNPDSKKKTKSIEVEENGATQTFAVPVVSGEKEVEYQINKQLPIFFSYPTRSVTPAFKNSIILVNIFLAPSN